MALRLNVYVYVQVTIIDQKVSSFKAGVRPTIVMAPAVGLALKDHGRDRTLKGLRGVHRRGRAGIVRRPRLTLQGPSLPWSL